MLSGSSHSLFLFYFNGHAAELKSFPFSIFILTSHAVAEAQVIPFSIYFNESYCR
jgi:hypothetical protein